MTYLAVSIQVEDPAGVAPALERAREAAATGASLVEWRVDALAEEPGAAESIEHLLRDAPLPCILTIRSSDEGGAFQGTEEDRVSLLERIGTGESPPRYIDFEVDSYLRSTNISNKINLVVQHHSQQRDIETGLILSKHDFQDRPRDLLQSIERMGQDQACAVIKVAWFARSLRDNLEAFDLLHERSKPMVALCMGPFGRMSRILAPKFGGFLTFARDEYGDETAPGQPLISELLQTYRFNSIGSSTRVYGIAGWPVDHSLGPVIHNAGFEDVGFDGVYLHMPIPPEYEHFKATIGACVDHPRLDFSGASVTMPHKEHLVRFVKEQGGALDPLTELVGAANTLLVGEDRSLVCTNTDGPGAVAGFVNRTGIAMSDLASMRIAVLGSGGAARAIAASFADHGSQIHVFGRTEANVHRLVEDLSGKHANSGSTLDVAVGQPGALCESGFDVLINCTPIGLLGGSEPDQLPVPSDVHIVDSMIVYDTVYNPIRTPFIAEAEVRGARIVQGYEMFLAQAAIQFEAWTGSPAPCGVFRDAFMQCIDQTSNGS